MLGCGGSYVVGVGVWDGRVLGSGLVRGQRWLGSGVVGGFGQWGSGMVRRFGWLEAWGGWGWIVRNRGSGYMTAI